MSYCKIQNRLRSYIYLKNEFFDVFFFALLVICGFNQNLYPNKNLNSKFEKVFNATILVNFWHLEKFGVHRQECLRTTQSPD